MQALYFGSLNKDGHYLFGHKSYGGSIDPQRDVPGFPWNARHVDSGLLTNGKIPDEPDGRVWWTCGRVLIPERTFEEALVTVERDKVDKSINEWIRVGWNLARASGEEVWHAFYWWDRSGDSRGASNSGFYVRGFTFEEREKAFEFACTQWPRVVKRQKFPLVLQPRP